jgi:hypothetical protein
VLVGALLGKAIDCFTLSNWNRPVRYVKDGPVTAGQ